MSKRITLANLASEAGVDLDEALVRLWEAGLEQVQDAGDFIPRNQVASARRALGIATVRELTDPAHWKTALGFSDREFADLLSDLGFPMSRRARRLPRGAVAKLKRVATSRSRTTNLAVPNQVTSPAAAKPRLQPLEWRTIGHEREDISYLNEEDVVRIHNYLVEEFAKDDDPIAPPGVRDRQLLASACFRPQTALGEDQKYPSVEMAAAALLHSLVLNHPFFNGNKRTALVSMLVFLDEHDVQLTCEEDGLFRLVLQVAQHSVVDRGADHRDDREVAVISRWIKANSRRVETGEKVIKWIRLKKILSSFDCWTEFPGKGNRINIYREVEVPRRGRRGTRKPERQQLSAQVYYRDDGSDVARDTVAFIRKQLWLDDDHGVDSKRFYEMETPTQDFIVMYRKTLKRLARL